MPKEIVKQYFKLFHTTENRINLYSIFIEKGIQLLNNKGILCYINPNSMLVNESYKKLRKFIVDDVEKIIKLPDSIFEMATVETIILIISKQSNNQLVKSLYFKNNDKINFNNLSFDLIKRIDWVNDNESRFNIFSDNKVIKLISKIENNSNNLENYVFTSLGITPYDKYRGHSENLIKNREFHSKERKSNEYVPLISGKNIHNYNISNEVGEYLKYGNWLGAPREEKFFINPKIIVRQIVGGKDLKIVAAYSEKPTYFTQIGFSLISKNDDIENLKLILCLLNSSLMCFYHKHKFLDVEKIIFQKILIANCKQLPIKLPLNITSFIKIINEILNEKKLNPLANTLNLEKKIDIMVYKLYDLTYDEVKIIDSNFDLIKEDYDNLIH